MGEANITVLVTVYNIEPYLGRFFDCLRRQTVADYKVLIIEDGSTDNSLAVCQKYAAEDDRIHIVPRTHIGISAARNLALDLIDTEYVTSLDGDDFFDEDYLKHLIEAEEKYDADLVISNVIYCDESGKETNRFVPREEALYQKADFGDVVPELLREKRLNYLYGKLYKTRFLKDVRVLSDVEQGSDTMINCQYVLKIGTIAVIEDYDYHYIKYSKRSVTSYSGKNVFKRLFRINDFLYRIMDKGGLLSDKMLFVIDERILFSGKNAVNSIARSRDAMSKKIEKASEIINSNEYARSYYRQEERGNLGEIPFVVIRPGEEERYMRDFCKILATDKRKDTLRKLIPDAVLNIRSKLRNNGS